MKLPVAEPCHDAFLALHIMANNFNQHDQASGLQSSPSTFWNLSIGTSSVSEFRHFQFISTWGKCWLCQAHFRPLISLNELLCFERFPMETRQLSKSWDILRVNRWTKSRYKQLNSIEWGKYIHVYQIYHLWYSSIFMYIHVYLIICVHRSTSLQVTANLNSYDFRDSTERPHPDWRSGRSGRSGQ